MNRKHGCLVSIPAILALLTVVDPMPASISEEEHLNILLPKPATLPNSFAEPIIIHIHKKDKTNKESGTDLVLFPSHRVDKFSSFQKATLGLFVLRILRTS